MQLWRGAAHLGAALSLACGASPTAPPPTAPGASVRAADGPVNEPVEAAMGACGRWTGADPCQPRLPPGDAISGSDDRVDLYCLDRPDCTVHERDRVREAARSSMAIFAHTDLIRHDDVYTINPIYEPLARSADDGYPVCADEVFAEQPIGASCSGVVIEGPRLLSARHCLVDAVDPYFVRGFAMQDDGHPTAFAFTREQVCRAPRGAKLWCLEDLCAVDLACEGPPPTAATVARAGVAYDDPVYAFGYPARLPAKFSGWSAVSQALGSTFEAPLDVTRGNSGSPVFNGDHELVGIINADQNLSAFCTDESSRCQRWLHAPGDALAITVTRQNIDQEQRP